MARWQREQHNKWLEDQNDRLIVVIIGMAMILLAYILLAYIVHVPKAHAQESYPNGNFGMHSHDGEMGKLYMRWQRPAPRRTGLDGKTEERYWSCCSDKDCHPVQTRMKDGHWEFLSSHPNYAGQWRRVPDDLVETNYADAELTPDGRAHACENQYNGEILCFTPGDPEQ